MEYSTWFYLTCIASLVLFLFLIIFLLQKNSQTSPPWLPIVGHLHLFRKEPLIHRTLERLSKKYGPIFHLRFGTRPVLILSSPSAVEVLFSKHDLIFANRPRFLFGEIIEYNFTTIASAPYGDHWRNLRRIATLEILSTSKLNSYLAIRQEEVRSMLRNLYQNSQEINFVKVEMRPRLTELVCNIMTRVVVGKKYFGNGAEDSVEAREFWDIISDFFSNGSSSPVDFVPFLKWIDFQNVKKNMLKVQKKMDLFMQGLIDENRSKDKEELVSDHQNGGRMKSMIDTMLELQDSDPKYFSDQIIKGMILMMLVGGTDSPIITIEWAMSLLLNNPKVLDKARVELDTIVSKNRLVDEPDLSKLPYIQNIINETLRLFPPAPLLVPHESSDDCTIKGHEVSRGTILMVNAWAIHRDPIVWEDPTSFMPERFEDGKNSAYKLIPFAVGRRSCPGIGLANQVMGLALATLIQCFDWVRIGEKLVDMSDRNCVSMAMSKPLEPMWRARKTMISVLSEL